MFSKSIAKHQINEQLGIPIDFSFQSFWSPREHYRPPWITMELGLDMGGKPESENLPNFDRFHQSQPSQCKSPMHLVWMQAHKHSSMTQKSSIMDLEPLHRNTSISLATSKLAS
jgi:hypothetical protein